MVLECVCEEAHLCNSDLSSQRLWFLYLRSLPVCVDCHRMCQHGLTVWDREEYHKGDACAQEHAQESVVGRLVYQRQH